MNKDESKLEQTLTTIERLYGKGAVYKYGDGIDISVKDVISTGSLKLDEAIGVGGVPCGRIIEIFGPESGGKTTLALHILAEAQEQGKLCAFIDAEHALDPVYAGNIGVEMDDVFLSQPDDGNQALDITEQLIKSKQLGLIIVDSVAALVPRAEIEGEMGDSHMGLHARLLSQAMRKLSGAVSKSKCCLIFINQVREKIGVMFGNPETTTGGRALKFYSSVRLDIRRIGSEKDKQGNLISNKTKVKVAKSKVAPPFKQVQFEIKYGEGIDKIGEFLDLAVSKDIITKQGSWYNYGEKKLGQGKEVVKANITSDFDLYEKIKSRLKDD